MLNYRRLLVVLIVAALSQATARAGYTVTITPSIGPNPAGALSDPSVAQYYTNALTGLMSGGPAGTAGTAGYYAPYGGTTVPIQSITSTGFHSWMAVAPSTGAYAGSYGNSIYFGLTVKSATPFTLSSLNLSSMSTVTDPQQNLGYNFPGGYSFTSGKFVGVTATNTLVTGTAATNDTVPIVALYYVGTADSLAGDDIIPPGNPTYQAIINANLLAAGTYNYTYQDSYTVGGVTTYATPLTIQGVPEPASLTLLGVGALGLLLRRRFARSKVAA